MIVVTGACGFIGSSVIKVLNDLGHEDILAVDDFDTTIKWKNLLGKKYTEFISRHEALSWLQKTKKDIAAIIHLGANSSTTGQDGSIYYEMNYRNSIDLANFALKRNIRFIYASSAATYGNGSKGFSDEHKMLDSLEPMNFYGMSKHMFDLWLYRKGLLDVCVGLKYFNVYGPNEYHKGSMASQVLHMHKQIMQNSSVKLFRSNTEKYQDGEQKRDFIYVKDAAEITVQFLYNQVGGIFNIGTGTANSWNTLAKSVFFCFKKAC